MQHLTKKLICLTLLIASGCIQSQNIDFKNISIKDGLPQSAVFDAIQDSIGYMWFATQGGGIARYDGKKFNVYSEKEGLLSNFANELFLKNDSLLVGTNKGLSIHYKEKFTNYNSPKIHNICALNGSIYLTTQSGIYALKKDYITPLNISLNIDVSPVKNMVYFGSFYWIETQHQLWKTRTLTAPKSIRKASKKENAFYLKKQYGKRERYANHSAIKTSKLLKVYKNKQHTWLLTQGDGVYQSIPANFRHYTHSGITRIGPVSAMHNTNNTVWFSNSTHIFKIDSTGIQTIDKQQQFSVTSITTDPANNLWIGSKNKGIFIFRKSKDSLYTKPYKIERLHTENGLPNNQIRNIQLQKDTIWVVTKDAGILKITYDFNQEFVKNIRRFNKNNGVKEHAITATTFYNDQFWYATKTGGLGSIKENSVTHYSKILQQNISIQSIVFNNDKIYLGTLGDGIWSANTNKIQQVRPLKKTVLTSLNIYQLLFDEKDRLWVGTEKGLDRIVLKNTDIYKVTHYNENDGFTGIETSLNTAIITAENRLWFGSKSGISTYLSANNNRLSHKPTIHFEKIAVDYQPIHSLNNAMISNSLQLEAEQNNISFTYKTVDLSHPYRTEYRWTLNETASPWTTENSVNFSQLKPGYYSFKVASRDGYKLESTTKTFLFRIAQPLHKKGWFIAVTTSLIFIIIVLLIASYIERLKKKNTEKIKQLTQKNRVLSLEQKALQLQMNPHFIFNVLNGIKALGKTNKTEELNHTIQVFANLLRSVLNNSRVQEISLDEEISTLKNYLELSRSMTPVSFVYEIHLLTDGIDTAEIVLPPMLVQPFVENCIEHGFKGREDIGNIDIYFRVDAAKLFCTVTDNGVGLSQSSNAKKHHASVAVSVTKERIKSLDETAVFTCNEIIENNNVVGTKVVFTIPLKTDF